MNATPTDIVPQGAEVATTPPARGEVVYLASSMSTYATARYDAMVEHTRRAFPDAELLSARDLYTSSAHWLSTWPDHLARLTALVFFAETDGSIGKGVYKEIEDALAAGIPVYYLYDSGDTVLHTFVSLILIRDGVNWRKYARVSAPNLNISRAQKEAWARRKAAQVARDEASQ
jgi:hypothetical protein